RIEFNYSPGGVGELTAQWWAQEYLPVGSTFQRIGDHGERLTTRLSDYAATVLEAGVDPVTGQPIILSAAGAVQWLRYWFDYQINLERGPVQAGDTETETLP
ncbi:hypothetical protein SNE32_17610, partial [Lysobacter sp. D1-1-M9]|uniref:hypothetical protein n=1 Tax=Novilysobacter longmucuonensis TaxID=3098603 RepID=UPI002FC68258